jgi:hypothetical protein
MRDWYAQHYPDSSDKFVADVARYVFDRLDERQQLPPLLWWFGWVTRSMMADRVRSLGGPAVASFSLGDIVSLALHDHDNEGLDVVSDVDADGNPVSGGYCWRAVGDAHLHRSPAGARTTAMASAGVIGSLRDLERVRGVGVRLGTGDVPSFRKADEIRAALGADGFAAHRFVPRVDPSSSTNLPLRVSGGGRAPLEWRWGQLGDAAYRAVDKAVKEGIAGELRGMAGRVTDPIATPVGRVYGIRAAFLAFVRHLRDDGITVVEAAVGSRAR